MAIEIDSMDLFLMNEVLRILPRLLHRSKKLCGQYSTIYHPTLHVQRVIRSDIYHNVKKSVRLNSDSCESGGSSNKINGHCYLTVIRDVYDINNQSIQVL